MKYVIMCLLALSISLSDKDDMVLVCDKDGCKVVIIY